ncbi:D-glycero-alpha-D-manno-heptose-1,7-bisphosphate 7-phosphatase [Raineya orbicola]|jgi:D-glycero-D-manno-heptose 1,7-bisphosphate phosphatase|uniref:D,D-heptose 1,7-bisphosphate phosphatase n=1 Tax=Raineya orbicola TaxID=2016530 RepID=A0A2N3II43_9BACT|nr:HAD-IIIA family hydrolase [Raineya orbicola]PKQ70002.1 Histidinol-ppas: histidinol-phosphate phosphatase domain [Raineya orbicola]
MNKAVFLDRDGVLNVERGEYTYKIEDFILEYRVCEALKLLKEAGFYLVIITNQGGIARGTYTAQDVWRCHYFLQEKCGNLIDDLYYSPYNRYYTNSLSRKPESLLFERAIARYNVAPSLSYMVGDNDRDLIPAQKLGIKTIKVGSYTSELQVDFYAENLWEATQKILSS